MAKKTDDLSPEERRKFRTDLAKLKKAGLVKSSVDVRSAKPNKRYRELIRENRGVIDGRERAVKLSRKFLEVAKEDGKTVVNGHVIIERNPGMRVIKDPKDPYGYRISQPAAGFQMIEHRGPEKGKPLEAYERTVNEQYQKGDLIGFTIDGRRSHLLFPNPQDAFRQFKQFYLAKLSKKEQRQILSSFTIYRVPKRRKWQWREGKPLKRPKAKAKKKTATMKPKKKVSKKRS